MVLLREPKTARRHTSRVPQLKADATLPEPAFPSSRRIDFSSIFQTNWPRLGLTYLLFNLESGLRVAQPFVLGLAIDGLLKGSSTGLVLFICQHLLYTTIGTFRQMYDTRVFSQIYARLAGDVILDQRSTGVPTSQVAARSALARSLVDVFEQYVPLVIRALWSIAGALILLSLYDWTLVPLCLGLLLPALLLNAAYGRKSLLLSAGLHHQIEREVDVVEQSDPELVRDHLRKLTGWRVRHSDAEALNFALMELFILGVMATALIQFCRHPNAQPGEIFAVFRYVLMFIMGLDVVPRLVEQWAKVRDIAHRL